LYYVANFSVLYVTQMRLTFVQQRLLTYLLMFEGQGHRIKSWLFISLR